MMALGARGARARSRAVVAIDDARNGMKNFFRIRTFTNETLTETRASSNAHANDAGIRAPGVAFSVIRERAEPDHPSGGVPRGRGRGGVHAHGSSRERF